MFWYLTSDLGGVLVLLLYMLPTINISGEGERHAGHNGRLVEGFWSPFISDEMH